jgi:branched-chain amino acid aminotransferase
MPEELGKAQEVFVTGTAAEITPVTQIGDYKFSVGPIAQQLMVDFDKLVRNPETVGAK